jgi:YidC/Oxa1 family membrane protein insertase
MEERRLLAAVALSLLVLTAYSLLFAPPRRPPSPTAPPGARQSPPPSPEAPAGVPSPAVSATPEARPAAQGPVVVDTRERRVEVVGPEYTLAFTNRGARLLSWALSRYRDPQGRPEEMVPAAPAGVRPLDIETGDAGLDARLREGLFQPSTETLTLAPGSKDAPSLRFSFADGDIDAEKTLEFGVPSARGALVGVAVSVKRAGRPVAVRLAWGPGLGNPTPEEREVRGYQPPQGVALVGSTLTQLTAAKLAPAGQAFSGVRWVGVESQYFAALMISARGGATAEIRPVTLPARPDEKPEVAAVAAVDAPTGEAVLLYVGAKDYTAMQRLGHDLQRAVPVGDWLGPIVVPLIRLLRWVQGRVGNWGWSIVLLTVLINLVMAPFRHYSIVNGLKMAKVSPEMRAIQERYRKVPLMDPKRQQMQKEIGELYAKHGMNMSSQMLVGCLPLLLTMPFLFAFYRVLSVSVELRGAAFLWVPDLSAKDPLFLFPIIMGVSMFVMQKMTPSTMDPAQQRIMMLMPVMLAGMFLWAPAGLNLYWLTSNLWSIAQQTVEMRVLRPAEARPGGRTRAGR